MHGSAPRLRSPIAPAATGASSPGLAQEARAVPGPWSRSRCSYCNGGTDNGGLSGSSGRGNCYATATATRDPNVFDFVNLQSVYRERKLGRPLLAELRRFLLELGTGLAVIGEQYLLLVCLIELLRLLGAVMLWGAPDRRW